MTITGPDPRLIDQPSSGPRIPLPPAHDGERARRRRRRQRSRTLRGVVVLVLVGALAATAVLVAGQRDEGPTAPAPPDPGARPASPAAIAPVLVAHQADDGRASSISVLLPAPDGGGTVVLVPPGTMAEVPSLGLEPVGAALEAGGADRLLSTAENLLGVVIGHVAVVDGAGLTAWLAATGPLTVQIPERVEDVFPSGRVSVLYEAGPTELVPEAVPRFLAARGGGSDLARFGRHELFWDAWLERLKEGPDAVPAEPAALGEALEAMATGQWDVRLLPVRAAGTLGEEGEVFQVDQEELDRLIRTAVPSVGERAGSRPRVRILNGTGELELAQRVARRLVPAGVEIVLTGNANPLGYSETQIIYYDSGERQMAEDIREALGVGVLVRNRNRTDVVDVTVIVGKDFNSE